MRVGLQTTLQHCIRGILRRSIHLVIISACSVVHCCSTFVTMQGLSHRQSICTTQAPLACVVAARRNPPKVCHGPEKGLIASPCGSSSAATVSSFSETVANVAYLILGIERDDAGFVSPHNGLTRFHYARAGFALQLVRDEQK